MRKIKATLYTVKKKTAFISVISSVFKSISDPKEFPRSPPSPSFFLIWIDLLYAGMFRSNLSILRDKQNNAIA